MKRHSPRDVLRRTALPHDVFAEPIRAAAPPAEAVTPALIEAAKKEGKVVHYTSVDLPLAEKVAKAFEAKYPGIAVRTERTGAERVFTRIAQEQSSNITPATWCSRRTRRISSSGSATDRWRPTSPRRSRKHYPPSTRTPMGCSRAIASISA
jgi:iron(III) transport system substrate-binding protein